MSTIRKQVWTLVATTMIALLLLTMLVSGPQISTAAPLGAVTPVTFSNNSSRAVDGPRLITFFDGTPAAYVTPVTNCYDTRAYNTLDIVYTSASVTTMTIEQLYGNDTSVLAAGAAIISANATPVTTPGAVQLPNFNAYNCIKITASNGTPVSVYVKALGK